MFLPTLSKKRFCFQNSIGTLRTILHVCMYTLSSNKKFHYTISTPAVSHTTHVQLLNLLSAFHFFSNTNNYNKTWVLKKKHDKMGTTPKKKVVKLSILWLFDIRWLFLFRAPGWRSGPIFWKTIIVAPSTRPPPCGRISRRDLEANLLKCSTRIEYVYHIIAVQ